MQARTARPTLASARALRGSLWTPAAFHESWSDSDCEPVVAAASGDTVRLPECRGRIVLPAGSSEIACVSRRGRGGAKLLGRKRLVGSESDAFEE